MVLFDVDTGRIFIHHCEMIRSITLLFKKFQLFRYDVLHAEAVDQEFEAFSFECFGYEDAIVVPPINANNFELKQTLINFVQSNQFTRSQDPHNHLRFFNKVTSTFRHPEVPNTTVKLLLFPFSLEGEARIWLDKEPPRSILTWEDLVSKFINQFFTPSKTTYLRNEIINFLQKSNETFNEAWEHFKDLLPCRNFLDKIPRECLSIIESKSKVRYSRSRVTDVRENVNAPLSSSHSNSFDLQQIAAALE
nr:hypothetical protein [Tanacetum cinerariifolium]